MSQFRIRQIAMKWTLNLLPENSIPYYGLLHELHAIDENRFVTKIAMDIANFVSSDESRRPDTRKKCGMESVCSDNEFSYSLHEWWQKRRTLLP